MFELSFWQILMRALAAVVIFTIHGAALALIARLLGDRGPQQDGRLTLNPFSHVDVFGTLGAVAARAGWIKPMAIDWRQLRLGRLGLVLCGLGALCFTLAAAHLVMALRPQAAAWLPPASSLQVVGWMGTFADLSVWFIVFNLLPFPPFTGGLLLAAVLPAAHRFMMTHVLWISVALAAFLALTRGAGLHAPLRPLAGMLMP